MTRRPGEESSADRPLDAVADVPAVELVARSRAAEARTVVACVDGLIDDGVSPSDVTVIVRDVDAYEGPLQRAARRYGLTLSVWTQLRLTRTVPYRLTNALVGLLAERERTDGRVTADAFLAPLRFEWVPPADGTAEVDPAQDAGPFPLDASVVDAMARRADDRPRPVADWPEEGRRLLEGDRERTPRRTELPAEGEGSAEPTDAGFEPDRIAAALSTFAEWMAAAPTTPERAAIASTFAPVFEGYRTRVLPARREADDPTLTGTARTARALDRMGELVVELGDKYGDWVADGYGERSWDTVADLLDAIATTVPGRREYATARSVDVMEANDVWGLDLPYVVAAGLVDGEWPRAPESEFPAALRRVLGEAEGPGAALRPRAGWTESGELDQFADAVAAAREGIVCTRFVADDDGVEVRPSPYLRALDPATVDAEAVDSLIGPDRRLPSSVAALVETGGATTGADATDRSTTKKTTGRSKGSRDV